jgi:hypothetical protein
LHFTVILNCLQLVTTTIDWLINWLIDWLTVGRNLDLSVSELEICTGGALFLNRTFHMVADGRRNVIKIYIAQAWGFEKILKILSLVYDISSIMPWRCGEVEEQLHVVLVLDVDRWSASLIVWFASWGNPGSNWIR